MASRTCPRCIRSSWPPAAAQALADAAEEPEIRDGKFTEIAGPQAERLAEVAAVLFASRGDAVEIRGAPAAESAEPRGQEYGQQAAAALAKRYGFEVVGPPLA
jgi:hypothetical protein